MPLPIALVPILIDTHRNAWPSLRYWHWEPANIGTQSHNYSSYLSLMPTFDALLLERCIGVPMTPSFVS